MTNDTHHYAATLEWLGNTGNGTSIYTEYGRQFGLKIEGKPPLHGSADQAFLGDASLHNPEDLLLAAISSCHMLSYLALCARRRISVVAYADRAEGIMQTSADGGGRFTSVVLHPRVVLANADQLELAESLHEQAHRLCFIANSCNFPIEHLSEVTVQAR